MTVIHGRADIERTIIGLLDSEKAKLEEKMAGRKPKFLFAVLEAMNYFFGGKLKSKVTETFTNIDIRNYRVIISLKAILDTILISGASLVELTNTPELLEILQTLGEHFNIGVLTHKLYIQRTRPLYRVKMENGRIQDTEDKRFYDAIQPWVDEVGALSEWTDWYFRNNPKHRMETGRLLDKEFAKKYGLKLSDLTNISAYFQVNCEKHLREVGRDFEKAPQLSMPFLYIKRKYLQKEFASHMPIYEAKKWVKLLEYSPGLSLEKHPLIPVILKGKKVYTTMTWIFTPSNSLWGTWVYDLLIEHPEISARGKWASGYGLTFQKYLDEKVSESKLPVKGFGSRKILLDECAEIKPWTDKLGKEGFEVDRFFLCKDTLFIVSCKAQDFLYERKIWRRDLYFPRIEVEDKVKQDIEAMREISIEADCIASCKSLREKLELLGSSFKPIVVTSRVEPMGVPQVRDYYSKSVQFPDIPVLTVQEFVSLLRGILG